MPGRSLTRPCPGTGAPSQVFERHGQRLSLQRARCHAPPRTTRVVLSTRFYARTFLCAMSASQPRRWRGSLNNGGARLSRALISFVELRSRRQSANPDPRACVLRTIAGLLGVLGLTRRPEPACPFRFASRSGAAPTSRPLHSISGTSQSRDRRASADCGPSVFRCAAPHTHPQTAAAGGQAGTVPDSVRFSPLHSTPVRSRDRPSRIARAAGRYRCVPFRSLKPAETGRRTLAGLARFACRVEADREGPRPR